MKNTQTLKEPTLPNRQPVKLVRKGNAGQELYQPQKSVVWYDTNGLMTPNDCDGVFQRLGSLGYSGVMLHGTNAKNILPTVPKNFTKLFNIEASDQLEEIQTLISEQTTSSTGQNVIASDNPEFLLALKAQGFVTCLRIYVDDASSLHTAINLGRAHNYLMIRFRDPTNIPLELVIASLQSTETTLVKEIFDGNDVDDAIVSLGVMEVGADGIMFSPSGHQVLEIFAQRLRERRQNKVLLQEATITQSRPIGMGTRSCIDLATIFSPEEGMIIGSTSQGGILCCPEVFHLPYMELRPFRINAGGVHSYVYNTGDHTDYMTELRAGSQVMIADLEGNVRTASVGRMKTEVRPLRLIEAQFSGGQTVNIIMQDDWHVRIYSSAGEPRNITELKPGDKVLGYCTDPGRHVGIKISENIVEN